MVNKYDFIRLGGIYKAKIQSIGLMTKKTA